MGKIALHNFQELKVVLQKKIFVQPTVQNLKTLYYHK